VKNNSVLVDGTVWPSWLYSGYDTIRYDSRV